MPIILVPASAIDKLSHEASRIAPTAELIPYAEDTQPIPRLDEADAVLRSGGGKRFSELVERGPKVRWLHTGSAGVDRVLTPAVRAKTGLVVTDSGPAFEIAIAEFVLGWMLMVARRMPELLQRQKEHRWEGVKQRELYDATVGIIGLGPIGRGIAQRAKAFGMRTMGLRRKDAPVESVDEVLTGADGLNQLLGKSDYVVLAAALTGDTTSLIGATQLARMKPDAWLINIARGGMIDEPALIASLQEKKIGGACLDVFAQEPLPAESPLWDLPHVYIAPHDSSGDTDALARRQRSIFLDNLRRFTQGEPMANVVNLEAGY